MKLHLSVQLQFNVQWNAGMPGRMLAWQWCVCVCIYIYMCVCVYIYIYIYIVCVCVKQTVLYWILWLRIRWCRREGERQTGKCDAEDKGRGRQENVMQKRKGMTNRKSWALPLDYTWIKRRKKSNSGTGRKSIQFQTSQEMNEKQKQSTLG